MPNQIDDTGLQVKSNTEIVDSLKASYRALFGADINLESNSPDGQMIEIHAQAIADMLELLTAAYSSFDVDAAVGRSLDARVALNGLTRIAGTYTYTNITVTVDRAVTLAGLDADIGNPDGAGFTVADDAGNQFILAATTVFSGAGSQACAFRAKDIGMVETIPNTIVNQVTVTLGVTAVNNPSAATGVGIDEETDAQLRLRHTKSSYNASTGCIPAIVGAVMQLTGVTDAYGLENDTGGTVGGVAAHSIWIVVEGGVSADIADQIYAKRSAGSGMHGSTTVAVTRPNSQSITIAFDRPVEVTLYIEFTITAKTAGVSFDLDWIKEQIVAQLTYKLNQAATANDIVILMNQIQPDAIITAVGVSATDSNYAEVVACATIQNKFVLATSRIDITEA